jgi:hypothetical protein
MDISEKYLLCIAHALYSTRLHLLTLTEVVRHDIKPDEDHPSLLDERNKWMTQQ